MQGVILSFVVALSIAVIAIPSIIRVSYIKHLYDVPDERKSHKRVIPNLGGLAIFAGFTISSCLFSPNEAEFFQYKYLFAAVLIIFFIGIKDDILITTPLKKLIGQILASLILVLMGKVRITSMYGLLGIYEISEGWQVSLTTFTLLVIMNGFNLIDGINWLAGGVGVVVSTAFGFYFLINEYYYFAVLSAALAGSLMGFLWFNKTPARIFMGDTGSLILGLVNGLLCIKFIELNDVAPVFKFKAVPVVAFGFLLVPMFDTLRVFIWRVLKGHSPLHPDQNHIHHRLLELGWGHMKSSLAIITFNSAVVAFLYFFHEHFAYSWILLAVILAVAAIGSILPSVILRFRNIDAAKQKEKEKQNSSHLKPVREDIGKVS